MKRHPGTFTAGLVFVVIGVIYLLEAFEVWTVDFTRIWPLILIAIGAVIIFTSWRRPAEEPEVPPQPTGGEPTP
jgi:hypothetical protein